MQDFLGSPSIRLLGLRATDALLLRGAPISLAINIASMQEMKIETINQYFDTLRSFDKDTIFYCCNREKKVLPSGEVISFENYPWNNGDHVVFDELCPWHQYYYSSVPPFYHPYEGVVRHRLAYLSKQ
ncbi:MAG: hypothetical protein CMF65_12770 [Magnetovibrio sp.]|nr:hypothetical protein [Magnetovibrio sp.]